MNGDGVVNFRRRCFTMKYNTGTKTMEFLLTNCPECHRLMVRSAGRTVCKDCFEKHNAAAENNPEELSTVAAVGSGAETTVCRHCGRPSFAGNYCVRCRFHLSKMAKLAAGDLNSKLERSPTLRGSGVTIKDGSRSHVLELVKRTRKTSFTPSTKYSGR